MTFIGNFTQKLNNSLQEQTENQQYKNLNKHEEMALKNLMERNDIIRRCSGHRGRKRLYTGIRTTAIG